MAQKWVISRDIITKKINEKKELKASIEELKKYVDILNKELKEAKIGRTD